MDSQTGEAQGTQNIGCSRNWIRTRGGGIYGRRMGNERGVVVMSVERATREGRGQGLRVHNTVVSEQDGGKVTTEICRTES